MNKRVFIDWSIAMTLLWIFLNWPSTSGLGGFFRHAGFPLIYAWGTDGDFQEFDFIALGVDMSVGIALVIGISWLCAWLRRKVANWRDPGASFGRSKRHFGRTTARGKETWHANRSSRAVPAATRTSSATPPCGRAGCARSSASRRWCSGWASISTPARSSRNRWSTSSSTARPAWARPPSPRCCPTNWAPPFR